MLTESYHLLSSPAAASATAEDPDVAGLDISMSLLMMILPTWRKPCNCNLKMMLLRGSWRVVTCRPTLSCTASSWVAV